MILLCRSNSFSMAQKMLFDLKYVYIFWVIFIPTFFRNYSWNIQAAHITKNFFNMLKSRMWWNRWFEEFLQVDPYCINTVFFDSIQVARNSLNLWLPWYVQIKYIRKISICILRKDYFTLDILCIAAFIVWIPLCL